MIYKTKRTDQSISPLFPLITLKGRKTPPTSPDQPCCYSNAFCWDISGTQTPWFCFFNCYNLYLPFWEQCFVLCWGTGRHTRSLLSSRHRQPAPCPCQPSAGPCRQWELCRSQGIRTTNRPLCFKSSLGLNLRWSKEFLW